VHRYRAAPRPGNGAQPAKLPDADHSAVGPANGGMAGMLDAPALILAAPDALAGHAAAVPVRAAAAERGRRRNRRPQGG
jgi:hypothetical protein